MRPSRPSSPIAFLVPACFFLSGFAGLALEMVWSRILSRHIGGSAEAVTAVVTAYMGGLGLGSLVAARFAGRVRRPLRLYALLEVAVGLFALASPLILSMPDGLYRLAHDYEEVSRGLPFAVRFATSLLLLMVPTFAMGATLPLLVEELTRRVGGYATRVAVLYGINTVGAVAGTVAAGFWLLPGFGNTATVNVAAALDLAVAALLLVGPARNAAPIPAAEPTAPRASHRAPEPAAFQRRVVLAAFALSGALAMIYELGWTRRLATLLGSSVYSFALLLATFLAGLGLGSLLVAPLQRLMRSPLLALAAALGLAGVAALAGTALLNAVPGMLRDLLIAHQRDPRAILAGELGLAALVLLPAALFLGAVFPLAAQVVHRAGEGGGRAIGNVYAVNTAGTVLGAAGAGLYLLPALGSITALNLAAWTHVGLGVALALLAPGRWPFRVGIAAVVALAAAGVRMAAPEPDLHRLNYGVVSLLRDIDRGVGPPPSIKEAEGRESGPLRILSIEEGRTATVAVVSRWDQRQLVINGKVDASSGDPTEVLLGQLPMILADSARRVLVIGYGSGITTHSVLMHPVSRVETVEIEPAVVRAGRFLADLNGQARPDPRAAVHIEDGRTHLAYTRDAYDVIISEPSNPWIAGINNLFTAEFYELVKRRLTPNGLFCQWLHGYDMSRETLASLLGTLRTAFPGAEVYKQNLDFLVVWKRSGAFPNRQRFEWAFHGPLIADLGRMGFVRASDLFALYLGPIEAVAPADWTPNTDDNGLVEFRAPLDLLRRGERDAWNIPPIASIAVERYDTSGTRASALMELAVGLLRRRDVERLRDIEPAVASAGLVAEAAALRAAIDRFEAGRAAAPRVRDLMHRSDAAFAARDLANAEALLVEAGRLEPDDPDLLFRLGNLHAQLGHPVIAEQALLDAVDARADQQVWRIAAGEPYQTQLLLGILASGRGAFVDAVLRLEMARDMNPYQTGARVALAATLEVMGRLDDARREVAAGLAIDPRDERLRELDRRLGPVR